MGTETEDGDAKITEDAIQSRIQGTGSTSIARKWAVSESPAAKSLSLPKGTLRYWVKAADKGKLLVIGQHQKPLTETELELSRLRRELVEIRMERDLLKKCAAYFAKAPTNQVGYITLLNWARAFGNLQCAGVEGTETYGAGLTCVLRDPGLRCWRLIARFDLHVVFKENPIRSMPKRYIRDS